MLWKGGRKAIAAEPIPGSAVVASQPCALLPRFLRRVVQIQPAPHVLVLGELCGANVSFLGERGLRVSIGSDVESRPGGSYAGALVWDTFSLMPPNEARPRALLLHDLLASGGAVLAFFGPPASARSCPRTRYRIVTDDLIQPESVEGRTAVAHPYQNREIIRLFDRFDLDLLHTHRDGQREVLFFKGKAGSREI